MFNIATPKNAEKIVLCGYYGRGNFGDEMILSVLKQKLREAFVQKCKSSGTTGYVIFDYMGRRNGRACKKDSKCKSNGQKCLRVCILDTRDPIAAVKALVGAELFIFGGGSLLQNATSDASLLYYIAMIHAARILCRRTVMLANGIGPIR